MKKIIEILERHWSDKGFLFKLRRRKYDKKAGEELLLFLQEINIEQKRVIEKRFVELIWMIPLFLEWRIKDFNEANVLSEVDFQEMKKLWELNEFIWSSC